MPIAATGAFSIVRVPFEDVRGERLRAAMDVEMTARYAGRADPARAELLRRAMTVPLEQWVTTILVLDRDGTAVAHAGIRMLGAEWEVKRVIVDTRLRGRGIGRLLLGALEEIARKGGARRLILQTGPLQPDAVALYERAGWTRIPVYEPYVEAVPGSICFEKRLGTT